MGSEVGESQETWEQYAYKLISYSSQYGTENSAYSMKKIEGAPASLYVCGDHSSSTVFRTYGKWWSLLPYHREYQDIGNTPKWFISKDFFVVELETPIYLTEIKLYETFSPGSLVRILVSDYKTEIPTKSLSKWKTIWRGKPKEVSPQQYRIYIPKIPKHSKRSIAVKYIRFEFNDSLCEYYHELDGVKFCGYQYTKGKKASDYLKKRIFSSVKVSVPRKMLENLKLEDKPEPPKPVEEVKKPELPNYFSGLPDEIVSVILDYITELTDLYQTRLVCSKFNETIVSSFVSQLNLQPFYKSIKTSHLDHLFQRYPSLEKLNLSWCGISNYITSAALESSFQHLNQLTHLSIRNCPFIDDNALSLISTHCFKLKVSFPLTW